MHNETEKTDMMVNWLNSQLEITPFMSGLKFIVAILNLCNFKLAMIVSFLIHTFSPLTVIFAHLFDYLFAVQIAT